MGLFLSRSRAGHTWLLPFRRLQVHNPDPAPGGVIGALLVFHHRTPRFQSTHGKRAPFEVVTCMLQHFFGVPVVGEDGVTGVHLHHRVVAIISSFGTHIAGCAPLLAFADDVAFLLVRSRDGNLWFCRHTVSATTAASSAAAISATFLASVAFTRASGISIPIMPHC